MENVFEEFREKINEKRLILEREIQQLIEDFEEVTTCHIIHVNVNHADVSTFESEKDWELMGVTAFVAVDMPEYDEDEMGEREYGEES